jgi:hypothetical protein
MKQSLLPYVLLCYKSTGQRNVDYAKLRFTDDIALRWRSSKGQILEVDDDMFSMYICIYIILLMLLGRLKG